MEACNKALLAKGEKLISSKGTILKDLYDMEALYPQIHIIKKKEGRIVYYEYEDKSTSIFKTTLNDEDMARLTQTLAILSKIQGLPNFDWIEETVQNLKLSLDISNDNSDYVMLDDNFDLKGLHYFSNLFTAIITKQPIQITYHPFNKQATPIVLHPYLLKQYNKRWFVIGHVVGYDTLSNYALDRIEAIENHNIPFVENHDYDFNEYFDEIIGVTHHDREAQKIVIRVDVGTYPYIETKPLHGTQKVIERAEDHIIIQIEVIENFELRQLLLSYGAGVTVVSPTSLRDKLKAEAEKILLNYQFVQPN